MSITPKQILSGAGRMIRVEGKADGVYFDASEGTACAIGAMRIVTFGSHLVPAVSAMDEDMDAYKRAEEILACGLTGNRRASIDFITRWSDDNTAETVADVLEAAAEVAP